MAQAGSVEVLIEATTDGFNAAMDAAYNAMTDLTKAVPKLSVALAATLGAALTTAAVKSANFEREMADVAVVLGDDVAKKAIPAFTNSLRNLAIELGHSEGLTKLLFDTLRSGVDASQAMTVVAAAGNLAEASMTDLAAAGDLVIRVLKAYKLNAAEAGRVSDTIFAAFQAGIPIEELASSISRLLPFAKEAGVDFNQLVAAMMALHDSGMETTESVRALSAIFNNLVSADNMPEVQSAAKRLGIEFNLTAVRSEGLAGLLNKVRDASITSGVSLNRLFSESNAVKAVFALTGQNAAVFEQRLLDVAGASGSVNKAVATQDKTIKEMFQSAVQLADVFAQKVGDELRDNIQQVLDLVLNNKDEILAFADDVASYLEDWLFVMRYLVEHRDDIISVFKSAFSSAVNAATAPFKVAKAALGAGVDVMRMGGGQAPIFDGAGNPIPIEGPQQRRGGGATGGGRAGAGGAPSIGGPGPFYGPLQSQGGPAKEGPSEFRVAWEDAYEKVFGGAKQLSENIAQVMSGLVSTMSGAFQDLFTGLADGTKNLGEILQGIGQSFRNFMFKVISDILAKWIAAHVLEMVASKTAARSEIADAVAVGSAKSVAAHAGIPFVGIGIGLAAAAALAIAISQVAKLGTGGIGDQPTFAQLFENGKEAVIPLETQQGRRDLAAALREAGAGGEGRNYTFNITGTFLDGSPTMWDRIIRDHVIPVLDAQSLKTKSTSKTIR